MIDIDHFKRLNDRYGHPTGDTVLRAVADAIAATVRGDDTPARYGGEEFAVVLRTADAAQAADVAERVRLAVRQLPVETLGVAEPVTVSVGVAVGSGDVTALVRRADAALYAAKRRGRDRVVAAPGIAPRGPGDPATDADDPSMPDQRRSAAPEQPPVSDAPGGVP
jgi:diguanylate cyclase (GGDEF)-like protein